MIETVGDEKLIIITNNTTADCLPAASNSFTKTVLESLFSDGLEVLSQVATLNQVKHNVNLLQTCHTLRFCIAVHPRFTANRPV